MEGGEKPRRGERRPAGDREAPAPGRKQTRALNLTDAAWERVTVYALRTGQDRSAVVEGLINDHLRRFVVQDRGGPRPVEPLAISDDGAAGVESAVETIPIGETLRPSPAEETNPAAGGGEGLPTATPAPRRKRA
jgi:hypothetical protein